MKTEARTSARTLTPRYEIRGATSIDEEALLALAAHLNTVNLPNDRQSVRDLLAHAEQSFAGTIASAKPGAGGHDRSAAPHLGIADTGEHIAQRIIDRHRVPSLPAGLHEARNEPLGAELAERDARHAELAVIGPRASGDLTAIPDP